MAAQTTLTGTGPPGTGPASIFKDVPSSNPNYLFINYLANRGLVKGYPDGTYRPASAITRAEAAAILAHAAGIQSGYYPPRFTDVQQNHWAAAYINACAAAGLLYGYPDGTFRPDARLTRAEGISLVLRLSKQPDTGTPLPALDDITSDHWAARKIAIGIASGMVGLTADGKQFLPNAVFTRGDLARALAVLLTRDPDLYQTLLTGELQKIEGTVTLTRSGSQSPTPVTAAVYLNPGDTIRTGPRSTAEIVFPDGTGLKLKENTELTVTETRGRTYVGPNGSPGISVDWLGLSMKQGQIFGALATRYGNNSSQEEPESMEIEKTSDKTPGTITGKLTLARAGIESLNFVKRARGTDISLPVMKLAVADKTAAKLNTENLPWWKKSKAKRVRVKVDMPWGVAGIRGTFFEIAVEQNGRSRITMLTGEGELTAAGQTVEVTASRRSELTAPNTSPTPSVPMTAKDKQEWLEEKEWAMERAEDIQSKLEPVVPPPPPPSPEPAQPGQPQQPEPVQPETQPQQPVEQPQESVPDVVGDALQSAGGGLATTDNGGGDNPPPGDTTPPVFATGYPRIDSAALTANQLAFQVRINENGAAYYVMVRAAEASVANLQLSAADVKKWGSGTVQPNYQGSYWTGSFTLTANQVASHMINDHIYGGITYKIFIVACDTSANENSTDVSIITVTTPADSTPPTFASGYPRINNATLTPSQVTMQVQTDEYGTAFYVMVLKDEADAANLQLTPEEVRNWGSGTVQPGYQGSYWIGGFDLIANEVGSHTISDHMEGGMTYKIFIVACDASAAENLTEVATIIFTTPTPVPFVTEMVDGAAGDVGRYTSLALDTNGYPHISYYDATNGDLKYAYKDDSGWQIETADSAGDVGRFTSLALDALGNPHISYYDATNGDLKYAYKVNSAWETVTLDHIASPGSMSDFGVPMSLALDGYGYPHISYYDGINGDLRYLYRNSSRWSVDGGASDVGDCSSIAVDSSGYPHISYHDRGNGDLKYAYKDASGWHISIVDSQGWVGWIPSLALDTSGIPHISYASCDDCGLKYAYKDGSNWYIESVGDVADIKTSLALDGSGNPHISYWSNGNLKYAYRNASGWQITAVDTGNVGDSSLALDASGNAHISYYDVVNGDLKYARQGWDTVPPAVTSTDPADNATGVPVTKTITVTFNENVQVDFTNITLTNTADNTVVDYIYNVNGNVITIDPETDLAPGVTYAVYFPAGSVIDLSGNALANSYSFTFTTKQPVPNMTWTKVLSGDPLNSVAYNGSNLYVAIGGDGTIKTSPDGVNWTPQTSNTSNWLYGVAWGGSQFVAVGESGTILTSPDGVNWTSQNPNTSNWLYGVAWGGSQFVAVGESGTILTSPDGVNWTSQNPNTLNWLESVTWNGSQFVAVGDYGTILTSPDGVNWTAQSSGTSNSLHGITWGGSQFVVVGDGVTILTSPDGVNWTAQSSGISNSLSGVAWSGSQFVAVGLYGTILTSTDGVNWTSRASGTTDCLRGITWSGSQFVAVGESGTILTSPDGVNWTLQTSGISNVLLGVAWNGTKFVAVGQWEAILSSPDGVNWTSQNPNTLNWLESVTWNGSQFMAVGDYGTILTSPDGVNWTAQTSGISNSLWGVAWGGSQFVAVGDSGTILTSPDGINWTAQTSGISNNLRGVAWSGSQFVAVGLDGTILTSPDGIDWTAQSSGTSNSLWGVAWNGSQFVAVGDYGTILTSPDGVNWTLQTSGTSNVLYGVAWDGTKFVAVGDWGTVLISGSGFTTSKFKMSIARAGHTATLLSDGKVLITGGYNSTDGFLASQEAFDPVTGTFTNIANIQTERKGHTATLLQDGRVLITGGINSTNIGLGSAEIYDPETVSVAVYSMVYARFDHTATLLLNGKVLITGGKDGNGNSLAGAELFDPVNNTFISVGDMVYARNGHTATLLKDGKVLIAGGYANGSYIATAEIFDPGTNVFTTVGDMVYGREDHTATLLNNGTVLITGGWNISDRDLAGAEIYDPGTGTFSLTGSMLTARSGHTATLLKSGDVLIAGGYNADNLGGFASVELYNPTTGAFEDNGSMSEPRRDHTATLLNDGSVLIAGGANSNGQLDSAELYQ